MSAECEQEPNNYAHLHLPRKRDITLHTSIPESDICRSPFIRRHIPLRIPIFYS